MPRDVSPDTVPSEPSSGSIKCDIVHRLAKVLHYRSYLEICTPITGNYYRYIDASRFDHCRRLMYRFQPGFDDGAVIDYRCLGEDIGPGLAQLRASAVPVDICLVDGWHAYYTARRDLEAAFALLAEGGAMVVHDCLPPAKEIATPVQHTVEWSGVSYKAFVDFVFEKKRNITYFTVDADYGCGVVFKSRRSPVRVGPEYDPVRQFIHARRVGRCAQEWRRLGADYDRCFDYLQTHQAQLLRIVSLDEFVRGCRTPV